MHAASLKTVQKCRFSLRYVASDRNEFERDISPNG
jgi:hypothetical protein